MTEFPSVTVSSTPNYLDPRGQTCSDCGHPAYAAFQWRPGAFAGFKCTCCYRRMWKDTLANLEKSLADLPEECVPR